MAWIHGASKSAVCVLPEVSDDLKDFVLCSVPQINPLVRYGPVFPLGFPCQRHDEAYYYAYLKCGSPEMVMAIVTEGVRVFHVRRDFFSDAENIHHEPWRAAYPRQLLCIDSVTFPTICRL